MHQRHKSRQTCLFVHTGEARVVVCDSEDLSPNFKKPWNGKAFKIEKNMQEMIWHALLSANDQPPQSPSSQSTRKRALMC